MNFSLSARKTQFIEGLGTVVYTPNVTDLLGALRVHCEKHGEWIPVEMSLNDDKFSYGDKILQAFKNCTGCMKAETETAAYKHTRFPEDAEL